MSDLIIDTEAYDIYKDIEARTSGEIYIGVVGPVRTGKSTFIKRFLENMIIPAINDEAERIRARDEMPQSAQGKTIMTTEPKFVPQNAVELSINQETHIKLRLIDCVGYMVEGASGHIENQRERLVKTPWSEELIPFTKAAELGTKKVIKDHSTIGIVITTDGSFGELSRENYVKPEEITIEELKKLGKPYIVILNTSRPFNNETIELAIEMEEKYGCRVLPMDCEQLKKEDITRIMENLLYEFPINSLNFYIPKWLEILDNEEPVKKHIIQYIRETINGFRNIGTINYDSFDEKSDYISKIKILNKELATGNVSFSVELFEKYYYETLSNITGADINGEYELICMLRELSAMKNQLNELKAALDNVEAEGYGVVKPDREVIELEEPQVIKNGNKYGVKIKAKAPSIHMIKANILTEIAPIVGSEQQAQELMEFIKEKDKKEEKGIWDANIFGKTIEQIVQDGISRKIDGLTEQTKSKLQEAVGKITNDSKGGVIFIIL